MLNPPIPNSPPPTTATPFKSNALTCLLLFILSISIWTTFSPSLSASFVDLDDEAYIFNNPNVLSGLNPTSIYWAFSGRRIERYMPLTFVSLELDASISRLVYGPLPYIKSHDGAYPLPDALVYHITNITLHILASWALFLFLYRISQKRWLSFAIVLLWALHPLRVESVAWVTERKDEIAGLFGFLALYFYAAAIQKNSRASGWPFWLACACFILSLWGKAMCVTLPALLVILDFWPFHRIRSLPQLLRCCLEKWPLWIIALVGTIITSPIRTAQDPHNVHLPNIQNAFLSYFRYLDLMIDFRTLAPYYPFTPISHLQVASAIAALLLITAALFFLRNRFPALLAGWLWYVIAFLPMIGFIQSYTQAYADRFSYLPSIGLLFMLFTLTQWPAAARAFLLASFPIAILLAFFSFHQTQYWHDTLTLMAREQAVTPPSTLVHISLGRAYTRLGQFDEAEKEYKTLAQMDPQSAQAHISLATVYLETHRFELAPAEARAAAAISPNDFDIRYSCAQIYYRCNLYDEAAAELEFLLKMDPTSEKIRVGLEAARQHAADVPN